MAASASAAPRAWSVGRRPHSPWISGWRLEEIPVWQPALATAARELPQRTIERGVAHGTLAAGMRARRRPEQPGVYRLRLSPQEARSEERRVGKECRSRWSP